MMEGGVAWARGSRNGKLETWITKHKTPEIKHKRGGMIDTRPIPGSFVIMQRNWRAHVREFLLSLLALPGVL
jgi:hypothetical protein